MTYLKINGIDYSQYVNKLSITTKQKYDARENTGGTLMPKYKAQKRNIQVGLRPLDASRAAPLIASICGARSMNVSVQFLDPATDSISTADCMVPANTVDYQWINNNGTLLKAITFTCEEK